MQKTKNKMMKEPEVLSRINRVKPLTNFIFSAIFAILALTCIVPAIFIVIISFSSMDSINQIGYSFKPLSWSLDAYIYLWNNRSMIGTAFLVSVLAIKFLMGYVKKRDFTVFGYYRIILGAVVIAYFLINGRLFEVVGG